MALKQFSFYKPFTGLIKANSNEQVLITDVDSEGDTLQELLDNATVGLEDMCGNTLQHIKLGDLSTSEYTMLVDTITRIYEQQKAQDSKSRTGLEWADESEEV